MSKGDIFDTSLGHMYGPFFLFFYGCLIIVTVIFLRKFGTWFVNRNVAEVDDIRIPVKPDPFEIAYLRGSERGVLLLTLHSLIYRKYLNVKINKEKPDVWIRQKLKEIPPTASLSLMELTVFKAAGTIDRPIIKLLDTAFTSKFTSLCAPLKDKLELHSLITTEKESNAFTNIKSLCFAFIFLIGAYKLIAAHLHGHSNVAFLIALMIIGCVLISKVRKGPSIRASKSIEQFKEAFKPYNGRAFDDKPFYIQQLLLSVYGTELLTEGSRLDYLGNYFESVINSSKTFWKAPSFDKENQWLNIDWGSSGRANRSGSDYSSGCGSTCGSSCGGGCGGGCGGCS